MTTPQDEQSGIDKRRAERVAANFSVSFRELAESEAENIEDRFLDAAAPLPQLAPEAPDSHGGTAHTENISQGGLSLTGDLQLLGSKKMEKGRKLLVEFKLPGEHQPVLAVAVVVWTIEGKGTHGKFTAGLMFTGVDPAALEKIERYCKGQAKG